jgi:hypothetical protein
MPPVHWDTILTGLISAAILWGVRTMTKVIKSYGAESRAWRSSLDGKLDVLTDATQTTMRTTILHYAEKYLERGWVTPEERASLFDMHQKYSSLHANGFIDGYMARVEKLPDREI